MAKKQTRRSVSIRGTTYDRIRNYCERNGLSMSEFVEELVAQFFGTRGMGVSGNNGRLAQATVKAKATTTRRSKSGKSGKKGRDEKLDTEQLQKAARYFTF